jgi:hypothetical protein
VRQAGQAGYQVSIVEETVAWGLTQALGFSRTISAFRAVANTVQPP